LPNLLPKDILHISTYANEIFPFEQQFFPVQMRESDLIAFGATQHAMIKKKMVSILPQRT